MVVYTEDFINDNNIYYIQKYSDYLIEPSVSDSIFYEDFLEFIPRVHELAHSLSGAFGGPIVNYNFTELIAIRLEIGLIRSLNLADRHLDHTYMQTNRERPMISSGRDLFSNKDSLARYKSAKWIDPTDFRQVQLYGLMAKDLMLKLTNDLIPGLIQIGEEMGKELILRKNMKLKEMKLQSDDNEWYYPEKQDKENSEILHNNELELKRVLESTTIDEMYSIFNEVCSKFPDVIEKLKLTQAIFVHVVFSYNPEFCENHFQLANKFPKEYVVWQRDANNKLYFDTASAYNILVLHYPVLAG